MAVIHPEFQFGSVDTNYDPARLLIPNTYSMNPDFEVHDASVSGPDANNSQPTALLRSYVEGASYALPIPVLGSEIPISSFRRTASAWYSFHYGFPADVFFVEEASYGLWAGFNLRGAIEVGSLAALTASPLLDLPEHARVIISGGFSAAHVGTSPINAIIETTETLLEFEADVDSSSFIPIDERIFVSREVTTTGDLGDMHVIVGLTITLDTESDHNRAGVGGINAAETGGGPLSGSFATGIEVGLLRPELSYPILSRSGVRPSRG